MEKENIRISKLLSLVLRHEPKSIGISLDKNGWTDVEILIKRINESGTPISKDLIRYVVENNSKKRFAFNEDETMIRANQGHSIEIELGYDQIEPPALLFHGTPETALNSILEKGIQKRNRHHVHMSTDTETARNVGQRYGKPIVLQIAAQDMYADGFQFFRSENQVWLTDHVPPRYITVFPASQSV
jgi:putative RNA 2'-phosphotransferase